MLEQLRQTLQKLERPAGLEDAGVLAFGIPEIDGALRGGLGRGVLHEIAARSEAHIATASGFALGLARGGRAAWIAQDMALLESGMPCGTGLGAFGCAPERLLAVNVSKTRDLLWAMEEGLRCRAVQTVIGELRNESIDPVALRRLSLAAAECGGLALLLRASPAHVASTAATRWIVEAAPSQPRYGPGQPRLRAQLTRNRHGPNGDWVLEWSTDERFILTSTHSQPVARPAADRSARAAFS